jgi:hypothetical protein
MDTFSRDGVINASVSHTHTPSYTVTTSCRPRDDVVSVISSFVPELSSLQTAELEMTIFNATVRAQGEAGLDATWNDVFKGTNASQRPSPATSQESRVL